MAIPEVQSKGLLVMIHELPEGLGIQVTALNFGAEVVTEMISFTAIIREGVQQVGDMLRPEVELVLTPHGELLIQIEPYAGKSYLIQ